MGDSNYLHRGFSWRVHSEVENTMKVVAQESGENVRLHNPLPPPNLINQ
jgi:hypothetical protein